MPSSKPRYIFFGSPNFAAVVLEKLLSADLPPVAVVCNPDKPVGRKQVITAPAVKELVIRSGQKIDILQPNKPAEIIKQLETYKPDFIIVAAYAKLIPESVLKIPQLGTIGVHPSLLPKHRGATPIQTALLEGESETGTTLYMVDTAIDHGPIITRQMVPIDIEETYAKLEHKLAEAGGELLIETLPKLLRGTMIAAPQKDEDATLTKKFTTANAEINFQTDSPLDMYRKIQALNPEPGVFSMNFPGHEGKRVKILEVTFKDGKLVPTQIQIEGKKPQPI